MYKYVLFKNKRGTTKLNLELSEGLNSLAEVTINLAMIIEYISKKNGFNFILSEKPDTIAMTLDENVINLSYISDNINKYDFIRGYPDLIY